MALKCITKAPFLQQHSNMVLDANTASNRLLSVFWVWKHGNFVCCPYDGSLLHIVNTGTGDDTVQRECPQCSRLFTKGSDDSLTAMQVSEPDLDWVNPPKKIITYDVTYVMDYAPKSSSGNLNPGVTPGSSFSTVVTLSGVVGTSTCTVLDSSAQGWVITKNSNTQYTFTRRYICPDNNINNEPWPSTRVRFSTNTTGQVPLTIRVYVRGLPYANNVQSTDYFRDIKGECTGVLPQRLNDAYDAMMIPGPYYNEVWVPQSSIFDKTFQFLWGFSTGNAGSTANGKCNPIPTWQGNSAAGTAVMWIRIAAVNYNKYAAGTGTTFPNSPDLIDSSYCYDIALQSSDIAGNVFSNPYYDGLGFGLRVEPLLLDQFPSWYNYGVAAAIFYTGSFTYPTALWNYNVVILKKSNQNYAPVHPYYYPYWWKGDWTGDPPGPPNYS